MSYNQPINNDSVFHKEEGLNRTIGVWGLSANMVNIVVGAGIFVLPAIVAAGLGSASIIAYLFCGILIALIMLCFAEVGSEVTDSGGPYTYIESAFGPYAGFLTAILFLIAAFSADAAVANAVADILSGWIPGLQNDWLRALFFFVVFSSLAWINIRGVKQGIGLVAVITVAKLAPLLVLVLIGWTDVSIANLKWQSIPEIKNVGEMSLILFFAFMGAESGLSVGGEIKQPQKTVPKAIFIAVSGVLVLYILLQTVSQGILGDSLASFQENPLAEVGNQLFGPIGLTLISIGAAVSMFGNLSSEMLSIPRVIFGAVRDDVLPIPFLKRIHSVFATPYLSIIVYAFIAFILASLGGFETLAVVSSASILLVYFGVSLAVIKLRKKAPPSLESFRIPGGYTVPILASIIIVWFLSNLNGLERNSMLILIAVLTVIYFGIRWIRDRYATSS
ncbi:APC family permease [Rhodohalobacter sulfatireducens]|uniref:APC family permease n=1 Tax=Rhodohalobacter sulfatireducens TaxID=2911366 RepID=A0ABS9KJB9_9BACT|nr:APC family permease [Rhodohalobacter sulfatireducens]MCG2590952.1 APC family permease [Rhodohalobacter sulfatireducens]